MANEYFSAIGSAISGAVTGIIDDPNYRLFVEKSGDDVNGDGTQAKPYATPQRALYDLRNKFITQNGFVTITIGIGRFSLDSPIEIRHPQGDRIGIAGVKCNRYNVARVNGYTASHSTIQGDGIDGEVRGSNKPRYWRTAVKLVGVELEGETGIGAGVATISGVSGEYFLVEDHTMKYKDDYDHVAWDYNQDGKTAKRSSIMGCNILESDNVDINDVKMTMKYYNFPYQMIYKFPQAQFDGGGDASTAIFRIGGCRNDEKGGLDLPPNEGSGYAGGKYGWLLPGNLNSSFYFTYSSDPREETSITKGVNFHSSDLDGVQVVTNTYPLFGDEVNHPTLNRSTIIWPHRAPGAETIVRGENTTARQKFWTQPGHAYNHISLNRLTAQHVRTILEFKNQERPGIHLDGSQLGFIHDLVIEGQWKQFNAHFQRGGTTDNDAKYARNAGIYISNQGNLSYDLGVTGSDLASQRFDQDVSFRTDGPILSSGEITIKNVGINGFEYGAIIENQSNANLDDINVSNCRNGIYAVDGSVVSCRRSTIVGIENYAIHAECGSDISASKSMVAHVGCPEITYSFVPKSNDTTHVQRYFRDGTFLRSYEVKLNKTPAAESHYMGTVKSWGNDTPQGNYQMGQFGRDLNIYDHKGKFTVYDANTDWDGGYSPTRSSVHTHGITGELTNSDHGARYEDVNAPSTSTTAEAIRCFDRRQYNWGQSSRGAVHASDKSKIELSASSVFYAHRGSASAVNSSSLVANGSVFAMNCSGVYCSNGSNADVARSRFFALPDHCLEALGGSHIDAYYTSVENSRIALFANKSSISFVGGEVREGVAMIMKRMTHAYQNSVIDARYAKYQLFDNNIADGPDGAEDNGTTPLPTKKYFSFTEIPDNANDHTSKYSSAFFEYKDDTSVLLTAD